METIRIFVIRSLEDQLKWPFLKLLFCLYFVLLHASVYAQGKIQVNKKLVFYFEYNSSNPDSSNVMSSSELKSWLSTVIIDSARIEGNTDAIGSEKYNYHLGMKRAKAVENFLKGFSPNAYTMILFSNGEEKPVLSGNSEIDHAKNRRVDVTLKYRMKQQFSDIYNEEMDTLEGTADGQVLVGRHGTRILIPRNLFYPNKLEEVKLYINEAMTSCDIISQRLNTISVDNEVFRPLV